MNYKARREAVLEKMEANSVLILFSGVEVHVSADEYAPFEANRNFFYLTGLRRDHMILVMDKAAKEPKITLYIEEADPAVVRWTGKKVSMEEAKEITGIENIKYIDSFESDISRMMSREDVASFYFDCYREQYDDMPDYNTLKAKEFAGKYLGVTVKNLHPIVAEMRKRSNPCNGRRIEECTEKSGTGEKRISGAGRF